MTSPNMCAQTLNNLVCDLPTNHGGPHQDSASPDVIWKGGR